MKNCIPIILFLLIVSSCTNYKKQEVAFSNYEFELPIDVEKAESLFNLSYGYYTGFYTGTPDEQLIGTQLNNYPLFMGSDNDNKESYYDNEFIGITFFVPVEEQTLSELKTKLEKQYKKQFQKRNEKKITRVKHLNVEMEFYHLKTEAELNIVLKVVNRKLTGKVYTGVSFYPSLSDVTLIENVTWID